MMLQIVGRHGSRFAAATALILLPTIAQAGVVTRSAAPAVIVNHAVASPDFQYGQIKFHPKSITISINSQLGGNAQFKVKQKGNKKNHYKAQVSCALQLGSPPRVKMDGRTGRISVGPSDLLGINVGCDVDVLGEGGVTGQLPLLIQIGL